MSVGLYAFHFRFKSRVALNVATFKAQVITAFSHIELKEICSKTAIDMKKPGITPGTILFALTDIYTGNILYCYKIMPTVIYLPVDGLPVQYLSVFIHYLHLHHFLSQGKKHEAIIRNGKFPPVRMNDGRC